METKGKGMRVDDSRLLLLARVGGESHWFFTSKAALEDWTKAAQSLKKHGHAVVDHFMGAPLGLGMRAQAERFYHQEGATFTTGRVGGGQDGEQDTYSHVAVRGDRMTVLETNDQRLPMLQQLMRQQDSMVQFLAHAGGVTELSAVSHRSKPMLAVYPGRGTRYMRHVDNPDGNGRLLTCLYYLNASWRNEHGGHLRLWRADGSTSVATLAPLLDRLVIFWSDKRVPHEVLPAHRERLAISVWFHAPLVSEQEPGPRGPMSEVQGESGGPSTAEEAYLAALRTASNTLRSKAHVEVRTQDQALGKALEGLRQQLQVHIRQVHAASSGADGPSMLWVNDGVLSAKSKILLHQLLPSADLATGCTQVQLVRCRGEAQWLPKLRGAKAVVLTQLGTISAGSTHPRAGGGHGPEACASVHIRRHPLDNGRLTGWPRVAVEPVNLEPTAGTLHVLDCAVHPLYLRLVNVEVAAVWSFGEGVDEKETVRRQAEAMLLPSTAGAQCNNVESR